MADNADGLAQFQDTQPILQPQEVNSEASGYEAFAQVLDKLSSEGMEVAKTAAETESKSMLINSVANIEQLKTTSEMRMLENPDQAARINDDMQSSVNQVTQNAYVNKFDRAKLNRFAVNATDDIALKGTEQSVTQARLGAAFTHFANFPDQLKAYQDALNSGDEDTANTLQHSMMSNLHSLVLMRAITPEQSGSSMKLIQNTTTSASNYLNLVNNPNATAKDYHTVEAGSINPNNNAASVNPNAPINGNTQWLTDYNNNDKSFRGVMSDINNGVLPSAAAYTSLTDNQQKQVSLTKQGVAQAQGLINSGEPFPVLQKTYQELSTKGNVLSYEEEGSRNWLGKYLINLNNGNYLDAIGNTPQGSQIMQTYINKTTALQSAPIDDAQKQSLMFNIKNDMVNSAVSYGQAHHIPDNLIKPIPSVDLDQMQKGFTINGDPINVIETLGQYDKSNQAYIANSLKTPEQRIIAQAISYAGNGVKPQDQLDLIAANQSGRSYNDIKYAGASVNDGVVKARIAADLKDPLNLLNQQYGSMDGQSFQGGMINSALNMAKYLAYKNNDFGMNSWTKYADQAAAIYKNAFTPQSGANYMVNAKALSSPLTSAQLDTLADYATMKGYQKLSGSVNPGVFETMATRNPLKMTISPTNNLQATDSNGHVYFSTPLTAGVLANANVQTQQRRKAALHTLPTQAESQFQVG